MRLDQVYDLQKIQMIDSPERADRQSQNDKDQSPQNQNILGFTTDQNEDSNDYIKNSTNRQIMLEVQKMNLEQNNLSNQEINHEIHNHSLNVGQRRFKRNPGDSRLSNPARTNIYPRGTKEISQQRGRDSIELESRYYEMKERLKNLHYFYKIRIKEEKAKSVDKNEFFLQMIEDLQKRHNEEIIHHQKMLSEVQDEQKDIGIVDDRMSNIKSSVDQILTQSSALKETNLELEQHIQIRKRTLKAKSDEANSLREELNQTRNSLEDFERTKLNESRRNKELLQLLRTSPGENI